MTRSVPIVLSLFVAGPAGVAKDTVDARRVALYLTGGVGLPDDGDARTAAEQQLAVAVDVACKASARTERSLRTRHGKKREDWPFEAQAELARASLACEVARFDRLYRHSTQRDIDESTSELRKSLSDESATPLTSSPEDAELVVKVIGRSRVNFERAAPPSSCLGLEVSAGGRASTGALAGLGTGVESPGDGLGSRTSGGFHAYTAAEPYWLVDACGPGMRWKTAAQGGELVLKRMAGRYAVSSFMEAKR